MRFSLLMIHHSYRALFKQGNGLNFMHVFSKKIKTVPVMAKAGTRSEIDCILFEI